MMTEWNDWGWVLIGFLVIAWLAREIPNQERE